MNDRELLELAAKAAGLDIEWQPGDWAHDNETGCEWNPLTGDGDALRLAVKLGILVQSECYDDYDDMYAAAYKYNNGVEIASVRVPYTDDPYSATRLAIVQIAAIIGKKMNEH